LTHNAGSTRFARKKTVPFFLGISHALNSIQSTATKVRKPIYYGLRSWKLKAQREFIHYGRGRRHPRPYTFIAPGSYAAMLNLKLGPALVLSHLVLMLLPAHASDDYLRPSSLQSSLIVPCRQETEAAKTRGCQSGSLDRLARKIEQRLQTVLAKADPTTQPLIKSGSTKWPASSHT
jgi:hypothetical protein